MADNNFSPLDPLGPEYGRINKPVLDQKGLSPFEGDGLAMPKINFPVVPKIPGSGYDAGNVRRSLVGQPPREPFKPEGSHENQKRAMRDYLTGLAQANRSGNQYAKAFTYDAGPNGNAFYKRYAAYGQEKFDSIGFSPLRDNEAIFNERTTAADDFIRMMKHSWTPLFTSGFTSGPKSLFRMLQGDFSGTDLEDARIYEEAAAIGQSSKGGFGAFGNNLIMNFAYTAGIVSEAIIEEVGMTLVSGATLGGAAPFQAARSAQLLGKIGKSAYKIFDTLGDVSKIKNAYKAINATKVGNKILKVGNKILDIANPLENTIHALKNADNLKGLALTSKTLGGFYRDVRNVNMALSEARLEAGMVENKLMDQYWNDYYEKHGEAPSDLIQYEMRKKAKEGSYDTLVANTFLIYGSNKITFDNITGPKGGIRSFMKESLEVSGGKFGKLGEVIYNKALNKFEFEKRNLLNIGKAWVRQPGLKTLSKTAGYFKANLSEGIQENLQEVIAGANERYYRDAMNSSLVTAHQYGKAGAKFSRSKYDLYAEELSNQFSSQGFETFASGFFMGTLAGPLNNTIDVLSVGYNRMFNKTDYEAYKQKKLDITKNLVQVLNSTSVKEVMDSKIINVGVQDTVSKIKAKASKKEALDAEVESFVSTVQNLRDLGGLSLFKEKLTELKSLDDAEFAEAVSIKPEDAPKYRARIDQSISKLDRIDKLYTDAENIFKPFELKREPVTDRERTKLEIQEIARKTLIRNYVFFNEAYTDTVERKADIENKYYKNVLDSSGSEPLVSPKKIPLKIAELQALIQGETSKDTSVPGVIKDQELINKSQKQIESLNKFKEAYENFNSFFKREEKVEEIKSELKRELGEEPTVEQIIERLNSKYGDENDVDRKVSVIKQLKDAHDEYVKNTSENPVFDGTLNDGFELLSDYYKLDQENKAMVKYINAYQNPTFFLEQLERESKTMNDIYNNRQKYFEDLVNAELSKVEANALLNALADQNLFISADDFADFLNEGKRPSEIFDAQKKLVYPEGTEKYEEIYEEFFLRALELKDQKIKRSPTFVQEQFEQRLQELNKEFEEKAERLPKTEQRKDITPSMESMVPQGHNFDITSVDAMLLNDQYVELTTVDGQTILIYKDTAGDLFLDGPNGQAITEQDVKVKFTSGNRYQIIEDISEEDAKRLKEEYQVEYNKLLEDYNQASEEEARLEKAKGYQKVDQDNEVESLPKDLYNKLFDKFQESIKVDPFERVNVTKEQELNEFNIWFKSDPEAKKIVEEYNAKIDKVLETGVDSDVIDSYEYTLNGVTHTTKNTTIPKLKRHIRELKEQIAFVEMDETASKEVKEKKIAEIKTVIKNLNAVGRALTKAGSTKEKIAATEAIDKLQKLNTDNKIVKHHILLEDDEKTGLKKGSVVYLINGEVYRTVTSSLEEFADSKYVYEDQKAINDLYNKYFENKELNKDSILGFIEESQYLAGFYDQEVSKEKLKEELLNFSKNNAIITPKELEAIINNSAYEISRIGGNYLDEALKDYLDKNIKPEFDESKISKEAYDNLFGDKGIITNLKKKKDNNEAYIVTSNIIVFDPTTKIAGEIDILIADKDGLHIVDLKTSHAKNWNSFNKKDNSKKEKYTLQQAAYSRILEKQTGVSSDIFLLPIETKLSNKGKIETAIKPGITSLSKEQLFLPLDKESVATKINNLFSKYTPKEEDLMNNSLQFDDEVITPQSTEVNIETETQTKPVVENKTKKAEIIQTNEPTIQTIGNVTFGTANKQGQTDNNEDAVYVDTQNGVFILADGMGGEGMITHSPSQTSQSVINKLLGKPDENATELLYNEYLKNKNITSEEAVTFLNKNGFNIKGVGITMVSTIINSFKTKGNLTNKKGFRTGATALKAVKTGKNTYIIEKVGDTVYFVVDKNGKVTQSHGLSSVATTQGYMFSIKDGKPYVSTPKIDSFTVILNEGETLVLATDFIETDKAIQDFIDSDFGKNLNFEEFQKNNKSDDSTFITIEYDAELADLESKTTTSSGNAVQTPSDIEVQKADIGRRRQEEFKKFGTSEKQTSKNNIKVLGTDEYVSRELMELAYSNDNGNNPEIGGGGQSLDRIIERGGYSKEELLQLLKPEIDKINAKYDAELKALEEQTTSEQKVTTPTTSQTEIEAKKVNRITKESIELKINSINNNNSLIIQAEVIEDINNSDLTTDQMLDLTEKLAIKMAEASVNDITTEKNNIEKDAIIISKNAIFDSKINTKFKVKEVKGNEVIIVKERGKKEYKIPVDQFDDNFIYSNTLYSGKQEKPIEIKLNDNEKQAIAESSSVLSQYINEELSITEVLEPTVARAQLNKFKTCK